MKDFIAALPKAELHLHIEGSFEPELMFEIAQRNQIEIPYKTIDEVKKSLSVLLSTGLFGYLLCRCRRSDSRERFLRSGNGLLSEML
jgi:hypothetical protein